MNSMKNCYPCTLIASEDKNGVFDSEILLSSSQILILIFIYGLDR
ncbi:unnamed protein product [Brassica rapa]|uniref:Uncharacterized protein n=1 Tax=Brassica campestris TaxID=3711 RepID=A0A8D9DBN4_BRACM|nr:unnamed protein product [Brassica rapa]